MVAEDEEGSSQNEGPDDKPNRMSALLDEVIKARKAKAIEYEAYLRQIAELAKRVDAGQADETPKTLDTPGKRALYNNRRSSRFQIKFALLDLLVLEDDDIFLPGAQNANPEKRCNSISG